MSRFYVFYDSKQKSFVKNDSNWEAGRINYSIDCDMNKLQIYGTLPDAARFLSSVRRSQVAADLLSNIMIISVKENHLQSLKEMAKDLSETYR
jgi:hypothetical protein